MRITNSRRVHRSIAISIFFVIQVKSSLVMVAVVRGPSRLVVPGQPVVFFALLCCLIKAATADATVRSLAVEAIEETIVAAYRPQWFHRPEWAGATYPAAIAFCASQSMSICPLEAYCPRGRDGLPYDGVREEDEHTTSWAPIADAPNEWVSVGAILACSLWSEWGDDPLTQDDAEVGVQAEITRHVMCCQGPQAAAVAEEPAAGDAAAAGAKDNGANVVEAFFNDALKNHEKHKNNEENNANNINANQKDDGGNHANGVTVLDNESPAEAVAVAAASATTTEDVDATDADADSKPTTRIVYVFLFFGGLLAGVLVGHVAKKRKNKRRWAKEGNTSGTKRGDRSVVSVSSREAFTIT